ncbi:MAG TPA: hypothetical protein VFP58_13930 [Candidatus Eisenbacteria bacterium]|nr:hypothetical protein [Candidatus Eisenbacteria bacterium]
MSRVIHFAFVAGLVLAMAAIPAGCSKSDREVETSTETQSQTTQQAQVSSVQLGRGVGTDKRVTEPTEEFRPNETIYATVITTGGAPNTELTARWTYQDGQVVEESRQTIAPAQGAEAASEFHVSKPDGWPAGKYKLEVLVNGTPAATKEFEVKTQS